MNILKNNNLFDIYRKTLNLVDYRLMEHCERVGYIMMKMLRTEDKYSENEIMRFTITALLHDIGAFKTEELNSLEDASVLARFELQSGVKHSSYGYLFLSYFKIFDKLADAVLFHHTRYDKLINSNCENKELAGRIYVADRFDMLNILQKITTVEQGFSKYSGTIFSGEAITLLKRAEEQHHIMNKLRSGQYLEELYEYFGQVFFSEEEQIELLKVLIFIIDFRSPVTVIHTVMTVAFSVEIGRYLHLNKEELQELYLGSLLHDIGKISTPISILEKPEKLTRKEFTTMKDHVVVSKQILNHVLSDRIMNIAVRHHEKLDGSGYPEGLTEKDLTLSEKILGVADITSALTGTRSYKTPLPDEVVKKILNEDAANGKLDLVTVQVLTEHYDEIIERVMESSKEPINQYKRIKEQYPVLLEKMSL